MSQNLQRSEVRPESVTSHLRRDGAFSLPIMDGLRDADHANELRAFGRLADYSAHDILLNEGDTARSLFRIIEGKIMLSKLLPDGRRQICEILGPDEVFGLTPTNRYHSTAEALTSARVIGFERAVVERTLPLKIMLAEHLNAQICMLHDHALLLGRKSAVERVASFILDLLPTHAGGINGGEPSSSGHSLIRVPMTRLEIADYLGLTLETVSRAFSQLKRDGILSYDRADAPMQVNLRRLKPLTGTY